jgi:beta-1,4-N-acetylglucosaminyltransferase
MLLPLVAATLLTSLIALIFTITLRLQAILPPNRPRPQRRRAIPSLESLGKASRTSRSRRLERASRDEGSIHSPDYPYKHIMSVLGSGGHTAEMLLMLQTVDMARWKKRTWVVSGGDGFGAGLAKQFEACLQNSKGSFEIVQLPRARRVHQSIVTAPWTSLICFWAALKMLLSDAPDIVLTNGPGTGVIIILASLTLRFFGVGASARTRCVYVESLARCQKLSSSGRLLRPLADRFLVQWEELAVGGGRKEFRGAFALDAAGYIGLRGIDDEPQTENAKWVTYDI